MENNLAEHLDNSLSEATPPANSIGYQLRHLHGSMARTLHGFLRNYGISASQWGYLRHLYFEDGLSQRELSESVRRQDATTVTFLKRMEKNGYVEIRSDKWDQRKNRVFLTKSGRDLCASLMPFVARIDDIAFAGFSKNDEELFWQMVERMRANFDAFGSKRQPALAAGD